MIYFKGVNLNIREERQFHSVRRDVKNGMGDLI